MKKRNWQITDCCGIYRLTCVPTGKIYIGSSHKINIRWTRHKYTLNKNKHENPYLQNAWNKYGEDGFLFEIIENVPRDKLVEREQHWLDLTKSYDRSVGYNLREKADKSYGSLGSLKTWIVTTPEGEEIVVNHLSKFCEGRGLQARYLNRVSLGHRKNFKGYKCRLFGLSKEEWEKSVEGKFKKIIYRYKITKPDGSIVYTDNLTKFCRENDLNLTCLCRMMNGSQKYHKGYEIKRVVKIKFIITDPLGNQLETENITEFCKSNNLSVGAMRDVYYGKSKGHKGYLCERIIENVP
jgi:group I intron endonuclease